MKKIILFLFVMGASISSFANNLQITNLVVNQNSTTGGTVTFSISWSNSWYITTAPANWDAVWVFVKFRSCQATSSTAYTHGNIDATTAHHTFGNLQAMTTGDGLTPPSEFSGTSAPQGATLDYSGATGIMLRSNTVTTGPVTISPQTVTLSITNLPDNITTPNVTVHVDGIEMVYVLPGNFYLGDGDGSGALFATAASAGDGSPNRFADGTSATPAPFQVTTAMETSTQTFYQMTTSGSAATATVAAVPAAFPKGAYGFYQMKYEITQGLYTEFLNTISSAAQGVHYTAGMGANYRGTINSNGSNLYTCLRPYRAMNQMGWDDFTALLDWACLRPMTECEFEKSCRGSNVAAVTDEFCWGGITANQGTTFNNPPVEDGTETFTGGNAVYATTAGTPTCCLNGDQGSGPARGGIFATSASIRSTAGAGYYGAMDLSGNIQEWVVAMSSAGTTNTFSRQWGDGTLATTGSAPAIYNANVATWPIPGTVTTVSSNANIIGLRGGGCDDQAFYLQTSSRNGIYCTPTVEGSDNARGTYSYGGRGVR